MLPLYQTLNLGVSGSTSLAGAQPSYWSMPIRKTWKQKKSPDWLGFLCVISDWLGFLCVLVFALLSVWQEESWLLSGQDVLQRKSKVPLLDTKLRKSQYHGNVLPMLYLSLVEDAPETVPETTGAGLSEVLRDCGGCHGMVFPSWEENVQGVVSNPVGLQL